MRDQKMAMHVCVQHTIYCNVMTPKDPLLLAKAIDTRVAKAASLNTQLK